MAGNKAHINPGLLIWARTTLKMNTVFASEKIGVAETTLLKWETGEDKPSILQLIKIAHVYQRPFSLFFLPEPPKHFKPLKDYRRFAYYIITEKDEYLLEKEILHAHQNRNNALLLLNLLKEEIPKFTLKIQMNEDTRSTATKIANFLKINRQDIRKIPPGYGALNYWKHFFEDNGIMIYQTTGIPLEVMRGACIAKTILPVILINSNDSENGRIFTLFHELIHITLREDSISNFRFHQRHLYDKVESFCNQVAAEILVPSEILLSHTIVINHTSGIDWTDSELTVLANNFCVSKEVILRRMLSLGKTTNKFYNNFRNTFNPRTKDKIKGGNYYRNTVGKEGRFLINLALQSYYQEKITSSDVYDFIRVKAANLTKLENLMYG